QRTRASEEAAQLAAARAASAESALGAAEQRAQASEEALDMVAARAASAEEVLGAAQQHARANEQAAREDNKRAAATDVALGVEVRHMRSAIEDAEARLRDEVRTLGKIEATLERAEALTAHAPAFDDRAELERAIIGRDAQLVEGRLELARVRRESESTRLQ